MSTSTSRSNTNMLMPTTMGITSTRMTPCRQGRTATPIGTNRCDIAMRTFRMRITPTSTSSWPYSWRALP